MEDVNTDFYLLFMIMEISLIYSLKSNLFDEVVILLFI